MDTVTCFSQRDPRWSADKLGGTKLTLATSGCLITAVASALVDAGVPTDPHRLNLWLMANGGYSKGNLFVFDAVQGLGLDLIEYSACETVAAPVNDISAHLAAGDFVLVKVDYVPGGKFNQHWVRLVSLQIAGGWIMDPWELPGQEMGELQDYFAPGWDAARGIFAAAMYAANGNNVMTFGYANENDDRVIQEKVAYRT